MAYSGIHAYVRRPRRGRRVPLTLEEIARRKRASEALSRAAEQIAALGQRWHDEDAAKLAAENQNEN